MGPSRRVHRTGVVVVGVLTLGSVLSLGAVGARADLVPEPVRLSADSLADAGAPAGLLAALALAALAVIGSITLLRSARA